MEFTHFGLQLPQTDVRIFRDNHIRMEKTIAQPLMSLGYNHKIPLVKNELGVPEYINTLDQYPKIRRVNNPFETKIYDKDVLDIETASKKYFDIKIESRAFYKLWELAIMFKDLIQTSNNFKSLHLAEGPGGFIQATAEYRKKFAKDFKNDEYHAITITDLNGGAQLSDFKKLYGTQYKQFKTHPQKESEKSADKTNGDLTKWKTLYLLRKAFYKSDEMLKNLESFNKQMPKINKDQLRFDLITADGGFNWLDENNQEQESYLLVLGEICNALSFQKEKGNFVLKVFDLMTNVSLKFILILQMFYNNVFITKPLASRFTSSEKYIVCMDFKFKADDKEYWENLVQISHLFKDIINQTQQKLYLNDFAQKIIIPNTLKNMMNLINTTLTTQQILEIEKFVKFVEGKNYYGQPYQVYLDKQKSANKYWIDTFFAKTPKYLDNVIQDFTNNVNKIIAKRYA